MNGGFQEVPTATVAGTIWEDGQSAALLEDGDTGATPGYYNGVQDRFNLATPEGADDDTKARYAELQGTLYPDVNPVTNPEWATVEDAYHRSDLPG